MVSRDCQQHRTLLYMSRWSNANILIIHQLIQADMHIDISYYWKHFINFTMYTLIDYIHYIQYSVTVTINCLYMYECKHSVLA